LPDGGLVIDDEDEGLGAIDGAPLLAGT